MKKGRNMKLLTLGSAFATGVVLVVSASAPMAQTALTQRVVAETEIQQSTTRCTGTPKQIRECRKARQTDRRGSYD
jgi:hypothetical protein